MGALGALILVDRFSFAIAKIAHGSGFASSSAFAGCICLLEDLGAQIEKPNRQVESLDRYCNPLKNRHDSNAPLLVQAGALLSFLKSGNLVFTKLF